MTKSMFFLAAVAALATALPQASLADEFRREVWVNPGFVSYHFDRSKDYRDFNYGLGAEMLLAPNHALIAGIYENSESQTSKYAGYEWRPLHWQPAGLRVSGGLAAALMDGYPSMNNKGFFLAAFPTLAVEGRTFGVNFILVPNFAHGAAVAAQFKLKAW
ncbi:MAG TPA: hypothetical protein VFB08_00705 [Burkholderiales bacterium]|nr:hypothetical protein [Burkholderiales bacterium]